MSDWRESSVADLADIVSGGTPSRDVSSFWNGGIPWVTPTDITASATNYLSITASSLSRLGLLSSSAKMLPSGAILFTSRASVGLVKMAAMPVCTNQGFKSLVPGRKVDGPFLFYQVERLRGLFQRYAAGSTFPEINKGDTGRVQIPHPVSRDEQRRIASVLESVDAAIESTSDLIAKHQQIKAGLMHDLFTRGVLPNGQLRPPFSEAPELYQETAMGWIPKDWRFTTCESVCEKVIDCKNRTPPETPDGYPVIRTPNVRDGEFVDAELAFTDEKSYAVWTMRGKPKVGDIVITREAPVGEICMIPERHPHACLGQRMMLYRPNQDLIFPRYFLYALQSQQIKNRLELISGGSTVGHVRVGDIRTLWMFMPESGREQRQIADALDGITTRLKRETAQLEKLRQQKLGLMQDLLTGRVSVDHLVPEPVDA
ncbi:restriction endonuclease subunit S [Pseudacidovorax sp. NFM-22]|uniref:restriction endonuclease subunit S n=1 Tax=Pseudacidovorax sp. NFM-22 TaxID=2744469 RepID=UPI001F203A6F|nr:restriction endonuclease subunit S [Pseudacidovorax sp. NFM-22]